MKSVFISIGILALIGTGGFLLYEVAYSQGETSGHIDGYNQGYTIGQEGGYSSGETEGYRQGETEGRLLGEQEGYEEGYLTGKAEGYEEGVAAGLGHGYTSKDPTYKQAIKFLKEDDTDESKFVEDTYLCTHFARDVCNNAEAEGLRCAYVGLIYPEGGHAIIAFNTIDEGLVFFDPQSDERTTPIVGKRYYECLEPKSGYYYEEPSHDDTIMDILVIW